MIVFALVNVVRFTPGSGHSANIREVGLQNLPLSVGVLTDRHLQEIDARSLRDWWRLIPNLNVCDAAIGGNSAIIRGLADGERLACASPGIHTSGSNYRTGAKLHTVKKDRKF